MALFHHHLRHLSPVEFLGDPPRLPPPYLTEGILPTMATDMDIEMDLDLGLMDEDLGATEIEIIPEVHAPVIIWQLPWMHEDGPRKLTHESR